MWVHYDSETGYVWPQVYATEREAYIDEKLNYPIKAMRLVSEPYPLTKYRGVSGSFGTEIPAEAEANALAEEREARARKQLFEEVKEHLVRVNFAMAAVAVEQLEKAQAPEKEEPVPETVRLKNIGDSHIIIAPLGSTVCQHGGEPFTCKVCRAPEKEER